MHKKKRNESVLAGELILTFHKTGKPQQVSANRDLDVSRAVGQILASSPSHVYGESLFNQIVVEAWRKSAIRALDISKTDFIGIIRQHGWHYDVNNHYWVRDGNVRSTLF
jgi:hypothetical protein